MLNTVMSDGKTVCQDNSDELGRLFQLMQPHIPDEFREEILDSLRFLDSNEEQMHDTLEAVMRGTTRALQITSLILDYAKLGHAEPGADTLYLRDVLDQIEADRGQLFAQQAITLRVSGTAGHSLHGSVGHFYSIFDNLILNARDALLEVDDDRERVIDVALEDDGNKQYVRIRDNANGIAEEHLSKIFEPFFSTKPTTGTGLGLSFVSKLVPMYGGTLDVATESGQGTLFTVTFPVSEEISDTHGSLEK
jgi:signal transduction histidine kinase